jgi:hypothetical protein
MTTREMPLSNAQRWLQRAHSADHETMRGPSERTVVFVGNSTDLLRPGKRPGLLSVLPLNPRRMHRRTSAMSRTR